MVKSVSSILGHSIEIKPLDTLESLSLDIPESKKDYLITVQQETNKDNLRNLALVPASKQYKDIKYKQSSMTAEQLNDANMHKSYCTCCTVSTLFGIIDSEDDIRPYQIKLFTKQLWQSVSNVWVNFTLMGKFKLQQVYCKNSFPLKRFAILQDNGTYKWGEWICEYEQLFNMTYPIGVVICNINSEPPVAGVWKLVCQDALMYVHNNIEDGINSFICEGEDSIKRFDKINEGNPEINAVVASHYHHGCVQRGYVSAGSGLPREHVGYGGSGGRNFAGGIYDVEYINPYSRFMAGQNEVSGTMKYVEIKSTTPAGESNDSLVPKYYNVCYWQRTE